jgi:hypothetical protein
VEKVLPLDCFSRELKEPVIPFDLYHDVRFFFRVVGYSALSYTMGFQFRDALGQCIFEVFVSCFHPFILGAAKPLTQEQIITTYKRLIHSMPRANQYLLLYVLDLLSVFARKSEQNLMNATSPCRRYCCINII